MIKALKPGAMQRSDQVCCLQSINSQEEDSQTNIKLKGWGHFLLTECLQYDLRVLCHVNHVNQLNKSHCTISQSLKGGHSFVGIPTSLYNITNKAVSQILTVRLYSGASYLHVTDVFTRFIWAALRKKVPNVLSPGPRPPFF